MLSVEAFFENLSRLVEKPKNKKFLLAVSGGADSSVMAYLFKQCGLTFSVAHCNFHLRGEESNKDMEFVHQIPYLFDIEIFTKEFNTINLQKKSGKSIEMIARDLRYEWFRELAPAFDFVVTAHNADDNAETLLLNLTRGSGLKGLTGIPPLNFPFLRPLLPFSSTEIREFAQQNGIDYRTDKSNLSDDYHRNKIRHHIIPTLKEINPSVVETMNSNISVLKTQFSFYQHFIQQEKVKIITQKKDELWIAISPLMASFSPQLLLYETLSEFGFNNYVITDIFNNSAGHSGKKFFSHTHQLIKDRDFFILSPKKDENEKFEIIIENDEDLKKYGFSITFKPKGTLFEKNSNQNIIFIAESKWHYPLTLRTWQPGDFFYPYGMKGKKKLSDYFTDEKFNLNQKQHTLILASGKDIIWIVGHRADRRFGINDICQEGFYQIEFQ